MTRVVILAAGEGTRLRPLTEHLPKTLVPLQGRPLLERQLDVLRRAGLSDISLVTGHAAQAFAGNGLRQFGNPRYASTNMVASLACAESLFDGGDDVVVAYGDIVYEPRVLATLLATAAPLAVVVDRAWLRLWQLRMDDPLADAETLRLDADGCITELGRKPRTLSEIQGQYIGLFKVDRQLAPQFLAPYLQWPADRLCHGRPRERMYMTDHLQNLIDQGTRTRAALIDGGWIELDSTGDLQHYDAAARAGTLRNVIDLAA